MSQAILMTKGHQPPAAFAWPLAPGRALTLAAARHARGLWVHEGRVWLTRAREGEMPDDVWLEAGQGLVLEPGAEWVAEGWPRASLSVLQAPAAALSRDRQPQRASRLASWLGV